jgi:hypothetical protein
MVRLGSDVGFSFRRPSLDCKFGLERPSLDWSRIETRLIFYSTLRPQILLRNYILIYFNNNMCCAGPFGLTFGKVK